MKVKYDDWIGSDFGIKPTRSQDDNSFNNIVYSTALLIAMDRYNRTKISKAEYEKFIRLYRAHLVATNTPDGLYKPKNSHDNIMAKIAGLTVVMPIDVSQMNADKAVSKKHPRDVILFRYLLDGGLLWTALMPLAILDMVRAAVAKKVRPEWYSKKYFWFRVKVALGISKPRLEYKIVGGTEEVHSTPNGDQWLRRLQNDGRILNLFRLYALRDDKKFKWLLPLFKKLYVWNMGENFQSKMMENYYQEDDHPVIFAYRMLDSLGITVLD